MKLDINRAWTDALNLIQSNRSVVAVVAGVFFFLPYLTLVLFMPDMSASVDIESNPSDPTAAMEQIMAIYSNIWWAIGLLAVAQTIGTLALLALLRAEGRPTVGEAIVSALIGFLTYLGAMVLFYIVAGLGGGVLLGIAMASKITALAVIVGIVLFVAIVYLAVKFSLLAPVIAIDKMYNPLSALARSWRLTKGNSLRLFAFYVLLVIALMVISLVLGMIVMLIFGLAGPETMAIGSGIVNSVFNAIYVVLMLGILAAVHRQLAGPDAETISEDFE